jgi:hypothetical protein
MTMMLLRRLLARLQAVLLTALRRGAHRPAPPRRARHVAIASHSRRYPGRSTALSLRQTPGWIAAASLHSHQDRRA